MIKSRTDTLMFHEVKVKRSSQYFESTKAKEKEEQAVVDWR